MFMAFLSSLVMLDSGVFADLSVPTISDLSCAASLAGNFQQAFSHATM